MAANVRTYMQICKSGMQNYCAEVPKDRKKKSSNETTYDCDREFSKQQKVEDYMEIQSNRSFMEAPCPEKTQSKGNIVPRNMIKFFSERSRESDVVMHQKKDDKVYCTCVESKNMATIGLGRSGRRNLAVILDEFWGHLFDLHGHLTEKAKIIRADMLFGLDLEVPSTSVKVEITGNRASQYNSLNTETRSVYQTSSRNYDAAMQVNFSALRNLLLHSFTDERSGQSDDFSGANSYFKKLAYEQSKDLKIPLLKNEVNKVAFNDPFQSGHYISYLSQAVNPISDSKLLWAPQPFEGKFAATSLARKGSELGVFRKPFTSNNIYSYRESEALILHALRICIQKLLNMEGYDWLFTQKGGYDEELINLIAAAEKLQIEECSCKVNQDQMVANLCFLIPCCGHGCIWHADLIISFGIWCIHQIFQLLLTENRPELWGKYTYVLNRLQGILLPAFFNPRRRLSPCKCLGHHANMTAEEVEQIIGRLTWSHCTTADFILQMLKDVEAAISKRRGRAGTAAGDVAFPKGKENVASVLKRYKRRLSNKSSDGLIQSQN